MAFSSNWSPGRVRVPAIVPAGSSITELARRAPDRRPGRTDARTLTTRRSRSRYLDRNRRAVKVRASVRPGRLSGALRANSVIELPAGTIAGTRTRPGDQFELNAISDPC